LSDNIDEIFDQRRHRRVSSQGQARVNFSGRWQACDIVDISGGGARFRSDIRPLESANVLVQLRGLGMIRARVVTRDSRSFAVEFNPKDYDPDALVDSLMLHANARLLAGDEEPAELQAPAEEKAPRLAGSEVVRALRSAQEAAWRADESAGGAKTAKAARGGSAFLKFARRK